jgi:hypothetical protein
MTDEQKIEELYERCINLEYIRYELEDKIGAILNCLLHSNITLEQMDKIHKIIEG